MDAELERIAELYRAAYFARDPRRAPIAAGVRFSENQVEMDFPDASWDVVTGERGRAVMLCDPEVGQAGFFTAVMMNETPGYLAARLKIEAGSIIEIEHLLCTRRLLSSPPTPFSDPGDAPYDAELDRTLGAAERMPRAAMIELANGYFDTLENNTGEIRGVRFAPGAARRAHGLTFPDVERQLRLGSFRFNARVRDREPVIIDEARGLLMARAFIDHKGALEMFTLTDGTPRRSDFREPHTWAVFELFKMRDGCIAQVEATFIAVPYRMRSPWGSDPGHRPT